MPNLHSEIKALLPIDCKRKVDAVFRILKKRGTVINSFINDMICNHIKGRYVLEYYKNNVASVINKIKSNPISSKSTTNGIVKISPQKDYSSSYYLLGDNDSSSEVKAKSKNSSKNDFTWADVQAFVSDVQAMDKITKEEKEAAEKWKPQPQIVERKEEETKNKNIEDSSQASVSHSVAPVRIRTKESLSDIVEDLNACEKVRNKLSVFAVARVHCMYDKNYKTFWFTNKAYKPRELSGLGNFGSFVPKYSDVAIKMQRSKVGSSFDYSMINRIKRVEEHHVFLENQSDLQNHTIAIAGDKLTYQYRSIQSFLNDLRKNSEKVRDIESKIISLNEKKKNNPQKQSQINDSLKNLEDEYRILTLQQEDLKNITIYIRKQGEMRYSQIVDPIQTGIMSENLYNGKTVVIKGGPGTGKTTTMIHRLAYLTDLYAIDEDEKNKLNKYKITSLQRKQLREAIKTNRDWMFFSPSQMLKEYLADAMKKEGLTNTSEKVWNWKDYCRMILQDYYHLLESDGNSAPFKVCFKSDELFYHDSNIITVFNDFYLDQLREIKTKLPSVNSNGPIYAWTAIAQNIQKRFDDVDNYSLAQFVSLFNSLESVYANDCKKLLGERNNVLNELAENICNLLDENNEAKNNIEDIIELSSDELQEEISGEIIDDSDDEKKYNLVGKIQKKIKSIRNNKEEHELFGDIQKWLKSYCYSRVSESYEMSDEHNLITDILFPLIEGKFDNKIQKISELMVFEQFAQYTRGVRAIMLNGIPTRYKKFRNYLIKSKFEGCNLELLRDIIHNKQGKELHHQEQSLLLGFINTLVKQIKATTNAKLKHDYIEAYEEVARPIIGVDEATDFSICDIYAMQSLLTREYNSLTLCGDMMQRMTSYGIKSWDELNDIVSNPILVEMKTSYRQSVKLLEVARQLYKDTLGETPSYKAFMKSKKVPAPLVYVEENELYKIDWISKRITEVFRAYGEQLPSIAIFVTDKGYIPNFIERLQNTDFFKEKRVKVVDGTIENDIQENHISVYPINMVKGMEFDVVFFHNIDKSDVNVDLLKRYIYVGVSRAAFFLGVTMYKENRNISRFFEKNKDWFNI